MAGVAVRPLAGAAAPSVLPGLGPGRFAPAGGEVTPAFASALANFVASARGGLVALTGAGCSTESGVPDYRSPEGSYSKGHKPMLHAEFVGHASQRARYWARSLRGWRLFAGARPNVSHHALAALERDGLLRGIVTQNVDRLHSRAGSKRMVELHGRNDEVACRSCGLRKPREEHQTEVERVNAEWMRRNLPSDWSDQDLRADGDAHLASEDFAGFLVPDCHRCGGVLMPNVVFFGGALQPEVRDEASQLIAEAQRLLVLGSSCQVFSAFRLVRQAAQEGKPIAIVNIGETRVDELAALRLHLRCGEALMSACDRLGVAVPVSA